MTLINWNNLANLRVVGHPDARVLRADPSGRSNRFVHFNIDVSDYKTDSGAEYTAAGAHTCCLLPNIIEHTTPLLTPETPFPATFTTKGGGMATVLARSDGAYVGIVHAEKHGHPRLWDECGQYLTSDGTIYPSDFDCLINPTTEIRARWNALTETQQDIAQLIYRANLTKKINAIRLLRTLLGPDWGLTDTKRLYEDILSA